MAMDVYLIPTRMKPMALLSMEREYYNPKIDFGFSIKHKEKYKIAAVVAKQSQHWMPYSVLKLEFIIHK